MGSILTSGISMDPDLGQSIVPGCLHKNIYVPGFGCQEAEPEGRLQDIKIKGQCLNSTTADVPLSTDYILLPDSDKGAFGTCTQILLPQIILNAE